MTENTIKVKHPKFGLVTFSMMTDRQMDVLNNYKKLTSVRKHSKKTTTTTSKRRTTPIY